LAWSPPQRRALFVLLAGLWVLIAVRYACNPSYVSDPQPLVPSRYEELADRIDPNTADWQTLAALPAIGEKRARQIVAYREQFAAQHPGEVAFRSVEDLHRIKGVGRAMTSSLRPFLIFPSSEPERR
jgi:DNA uptake protein ComE-like DNA-binding protein